MKKIVILLLVLVLAACGGNNDDGGGDDETLPVESSTPTAEPTAKPSPEPTPEPELEIAELSVTEEVLIGTGTFRNKAWSPDSSQIVVSTGAGALLYDAADLSAEPTLLRINGGAWYSTFSPDGTRLATVNEEVPLFAADTQFVHLWDLTTNERVAEFSTGQDRVNRLVFSSDGTLLAGAANDQVYVWDATNLAVVDEINSGEHDLQTVAISPDNNLIAWALLDELHLYARDTGEETIIPFSESQQNTIAFIVFSPDGTQIALSSTSDATLVLDVASGEVVFSDAENRASGDLHYDAEGNLVISEAFDVTVVDPATGEEIAVYTTINARRGLLSPDNTRLMAIEGLRIMVTDTATRKELSAVDLADYNKPPLVLPDYSVIIARQWDSPRLVLLDPADGSEIDTVTLSAGVAKNALSLSSDGARLVAGTLSKTVAVVDTTTWEEIATHEQPFSPVAVAISSDHALVAVASSRSSDPRGVGVIDAETGEEKWFTELEQEAAGLIFSPDDAQVIGVTYDFLYVFDAATGEIQHEINREDQPGGEFFTYTPDESALVLYGEAWYFSSTFINFYDPTTYDLIESVPGQHNYGVMGVVFSEDGTQMVTVGRDILLNQWDGIERQIVAGAAVLPDQMRGLARLNAEATRVVTTSYGGVLQIWTIGAE